MPLSTVLDDFSDCLAAYPDLDPAVALMMDAIRLSASVLSHFPDMLGAQITARLLPYYRTHEPIRAFGQFFFTSTQRKATHATQCSYVFVSDAGDARKARKKLRNKLK